MVTLVVVVSVVGYVYLLPKKEPIPQVLGLQTTDWKTFDPAYLTLMQESAIAPNIYSSLVRYKYGTVEIESDLAEKWDVSKDGLVYTFYLRKGVKWHKGFGTLTAHDVKYSFERIMNPDTKAPLRGEFTSIKDITVVDDYTVRIVLKYSFAPFMDKIVGYKNAFIVNKKAVEQYGADYGINPVGTGPFYWERGSPRTEIVLKAFDDYWEGPPKLRQITFKLISEPSVAYLAFEGKDLDLVNVRDPATIERYSKDPKIILYNTSGLNLNYIVMNYKVKPFDDIRVRQAVNYAINSKAMLDTVLKGAGAELTGPIPTTCFGYESNVKRYNYDPAKAKQLLADAGYPNGFSTILYTYIGGPAVPACTVVQHDLAQVGIKAELKALEIATSMDLVQSGTAPMAFWRITRPEPDGFLYPVFYSKSFPQWNFGYYNNSKVDDLILRGRVTPDPVERKKIYSEAQKMIVEDAPVAFLFSDLLVTAGHANVKGYKIDPLWNSYCYPVYIEGSATAKAMCLIVPLRFWTKPDESS